MKAYHVIWCVAYHTICCSVKCESKGLCYNYLEGKGGGGGVVPPPLKKKKLIKAPLTFLSKSRNFILAKYGSLFFAKH